MPLDSTFAPLWRNQTNSRIYFDAYRAKGARPLFFVGSGISVGAGLPTWRTLLLRLSEATKNRPLIQKVAALLDSHEETRYQQAGSLLYEEFFANADGSDTDWRRELAKQLDPPGVVSRPSRVHDLLVNLNWHRIITTNYDRLLEQAIVRTGKENVLVSNPWKATRLLLESHRGPCLYKIHGDISDPQSKIVLTTSDYEALYREGISGIFERTLGSLLRSATVVIFIGYGHNDQYVHRVIKSSMEYMASRNIFALVPSTDDFSNPSEFTNHLDNISNELGISFIPYNSVSDHAELVSFFEYLSDPEDFSARYVSGRHVRRPTIVMLYCGGTIGSELQDLPQSETELGVTVRESRYDRDLSRFSRRLLSWHSQLYNAGDRIRLDVQWEVLPTAAQILSENATPSIWNSIVKKIEDILYKYFYGPELVAEGQISDERLQDIFKEEMRQYAHTHGGEVLSHKQFISDLRNRYVLGIVLLHGTDTMAYTAPALAFALHNLPVQ